ncbi:MAG: rhodanese-like domain-containing protein [Bacteroidota bacterium]
MKKRLFGTYTLLLIASFVLIIVSCKKDGCTDPIATNYDDKAKKDDGSCQYASIDPYVEMTNYMKTNNLDLDDLTTDWVIPASDLSTQLSTYYIIDLRDAVDYNLGHIPGAVNCTLANIVDQAANNGGKPIVVVCYTGQAAGHGHVALRLSGYNSKILKFGMSSWHTDFDKWTANVGNIATTSTNWSSTNTLETPVSFSVSSFTSTSTTGEAILAERVDYMLSLGFKGVNASDVLATPSNYFINNYWTEADVNTYGHIKTAYRIKENLTLANDGFKNLDKDDQVVTYCWTGQTSSVVTAYLTVLGYDAVSLKFGTNSMIYDALLVNKWTGSGTYAYE